jgi:hypothetical protein
MKTINKLMLMMTILLSATLTSCDAKIKNAKTEAFKVYGNCGMCKDRIEKAAYKKGISKGEWNTDTKMLSLTYNSAKITADEVLKQIAYAGHDNDKFLAPDDAYAKLPGCCQYDRKKVEAAVKTESVKTPVVETAVIDTIPKTVEVAVNPLADVYAAYFALKDALAKDDGNTASAKAKVLFNAIDKVDMNKLNPTQHNVWMKYQEKLSYDAEHIKGVTELEHQREHFISLSKNMYEVMKVIKMDVPVYYDYCPMANDGKGATWLSLEQKISNPYMGKQMPTCGKVQETLAK